LIEQPTNEQPYRCPVPYRLSPKYENTNIKKHNKYKYS